VLAALAGTAGAQPELRLNRYGDPYFALSAQVAGCPEPLGPRITEAEQRAQAHHRAERGTSCWLAGQCARPNAFLYDRDIAAALAERAAGHALFEHSALWATVQGRAVFIEGCVRDIAIAPQLEAFARAIPYVQQAAALVYADLAGPPAYKTFDTGLKP
jgi:hypothetical protein